MNPESTFCSKRLGEISHARFQTALDRMGLGVLQAVTPITSGNFGQNTFLTTDTGDFVFRGCPHYPWQFPKEQFFARLLNQHTSVPVPWPYRLDHDSSLFGWSYVIMPRMPGVQLDDECSRGDRMNISFAMGQTLVGLQSLTHTFRGEYDSYIDDIRPFGNSHFAYVSERLTHLLAEARDTISMDDRAWVNSLLHQAEDALNDQFTPTFVMQDFKAGNIVALKTGNRWEVSGVFDFMEPFFADGEMDLSRHMCCCLDSDDISSAVAFVKGYAQGDGLRSGADIRMPLYIFLDRLIIWNFGWRHGRPWWGESLSFREWVNLDRLQDAFQQGGAADALRRAADL